MVYAERCTVALAASLANWQSSSGNFSPPEALRHRLLHASDRLIPAHSTHRQSAAQAALESISCLCGKERDMREVLQGAAEQCDFPRSELRFRALMEAFPAAAYTCDTDGYITYFNRRSIALWGRAPKLHHADDRYCGSFRLYSPDGTPVPHDQCWMALALRDGKEYYGHEIMIERPDGSRWTALAHANPIYDETGEIAGAVNVLVDITDRKEAENLLREADRNKNEFLAMLAHELRNPLAPIRTGLKTIQLAGTNSTIAEEARKMMERQLEHMVRLIDDLLDLSRITRRKIELRRTRISLQDVMQDAVETSRPFIEASGHRLTVTPPTRPVIVNADRVRLSQVIVNLLHNSAKYTEAGGHIELTVERQGTDAVIKVRDNGIGVYADMLPKIFDLRARSSNRGAHARWPRDRAQPGTRPRRDARRSGRGLLRGARYRKRIHRASLGGGNGAARAARRRRGRRCRLELVQISRPHRRRQRRLGDEPLDDVEDHGP